MAWFNLFDKRRRKMLPPARTSPSSLTPALPVGSPSSEPDILTPLLVIAVLADSDDNRHPETVAPETDSGNSSDSTSSGSNYSVSGSSDSGSSYSDSGSSGGGE